MRQDLQDEMESVFYRIFWSIRAYNDTTELKTATKNKETATVSERKFRCDEITIFKKDILLTADSVIAVEGD